jgi:Flp pilus assembly protein CpaB
VPQDDFDRLRRNLRILLPIWSLAAATAASLWIYRGVDHLAQRLRDARDDEQGVLVTVPIYGRALGPGTVISPEDLAEIEISEEYLATTVLRHHEEALGRIVVEPVLAGDLVRTERLAQLDVREGLGALVPRGLRAVSLDLSPRGWVSDFVEPGNRVDVIASFPEADDRPPETRTLLSGVRVLAVDERMSETAKGETVMEPQATLLLTPLETERIVHTAHLGDLKLTLRSELDFAPGAAAEPPVARIARQERQMGLSELHERISPAELERMQLLIDGPPEPLPDLSPPELEAVLVR